MEIIPRDPNAERSAAWPKSPSSRLEAGPGIAPPCRPGPAAGFHTHYLAVLRRGLVFIVTAAFACATLAFLLGMRQAPVYQARASLEVQGPEETVRPMRLGEAGERGSPSALEAATEAQIRLLRHEGLIERVVRKLRIDELPEMHRPPGLLSRVAALMGLPPSGPTTPAERAVAHVLEGLRVRRAGQSQILEVTFDATDPNLAARVVNTLTSEFIESKLESRREVARETSRWLADQIEDLRNKLRQSQDDLRNYSQSSGLQLTGQKGSVSEDQLHQLQEELTRAQADRMAKQSRYEVAKNAPLESLPEVLENAALREYQVRLADLRRQLAELQTAFTPAFYKVRNVQAQIAELEGTLARERATVLERVRHEYEAAARREALLSAAFRRQAGIVADQAGRTIQYEILKREVDTNQALYQAMYEQAKQAAITSALRTTNLRVLYPAQVPQRPYQPKPFVNGLLGLLAGACFGVVFVLLREGADRSLRAPGDVSYYLDVPELGVIPSVRLGRRSQALGLPSPGRRARVELITRCQADSLAAESFRATLASMLFTCSDPDRRHGRVFVFSSPGPKEGKTTVVSNMGVALADTQRRVLLIDGDLRKPRLHEIFDLSNEWGLSNLLDADVPVEDYPFEELFQETGTPGLYFLSAGRRAVDVSNLSKHRRLMELLWRARLEFDIVLIDTAPILLLTDARVFGRLGDGVILVVRAAKTTRDDALAAYQRCREDGARLVGTVLNSWDAAVHGPRNYRYEGGRPGVRSTGPGVGW